VTSPDPSESEVAARKRAHLDAVLRDDVGFASVRTGLDDVHLRARALPEHDLDDVDLSVSLWGRRLAAPLMISCMTGGTTAAGPVNRALAVAAQAHGTALGLGSGRVLLEDPGRTEGFLVRDVAPDVLLAANLGAVHLRDSGVEGCRRLVERCEADVLVLHVNAVQEAVQPEGDTRFSGLTARIAAVVDALDVPVLVKEVGFGMSPEDVAALVGAGVAGIDVAGAGGTNWARVEGARDLRADGLSAAFADWGWPTAVAVRQARSTLDALGADGVVLVGSGGLRHGVDALKVLSLGASIAAVGAAILPAASKGVDAAVEGVGVICEQLRIAAWACGASNFVDVAEDRISSFATPAIRTCFTYDHVD
jgi:isopentenyl-diphosphate Delta-isomerase